MAVPSIAKSSAVDFTNDELQALCQMRDTYRQDRDLFSDRERTRLRFYRWLYRTDRWIPRST